MDYEEEQRRNYFHKIKPLLQNLAESAPLLAKYNSRSVSNLVQDLLGDLESLQDPEVMLGTATTQYIIITLIKILEAMTSVEKNGYEIIMEPWLKTMQFLLSKTLAKSWMPPQFTTQMIILCSNLLTQFDNKQQITSRRSSEEIKSLAIQCLANALPAKYKEGRYSSFEQSIYYKLVLPMRTEEFLPVVSPIVLGLLGIAKDEYNVELRLNALQALAQLLLDNIYQIDLLATQLPGVVSKLCGIISQRAEKEKHQVTCSALNILGEFIQTVMCDSSNKTLTEINSLQDLMANLKLNKDKEDTEEGVLRSHNWYQSTKKSLLSVMGQIMQIKVYPDWRTRLAFLEFANTLLTTCARTLDNCIKPLVTILVLYTDDPYDEVSNTCQLRTQALLSTDAFKDVIVPILQEELYDWMMKFPQYVISRDETEKANAMSLITGFVLLLGNRSQSTLASVLPKISDGWMTALKIDKDSLNILEEKQSEKFIELNVDNTRSTTPVYPKIRFKHLVTDFTTEKLSRLLTAIGKHCDLQAWVYHFMRYLSEDECNDPQAAYVVYSLLSGAAFFNKDITAMNMDDWVVDPYDDNNIEKKRLKSITRQVLVDTMEILQNATSTKKSTALTSTHNSKMDEESSYILSVCFGLQLVGLTAYIVDQETLNDQLINLLYPLLAHLGSSNVFIHSYALITLDTIALICGLDNAQTLAIQNIDYIINMLSQRIAVLSDNARIPLVLKALIHVGGYASIGYLDDTVLEIYDALDRYSLDGWLSIQLCDVLFEIIRTLEKNISPLLVKFEELVEPTKSPLATEILSFITNKEDIYGFEPEEFKSMDEIGKYFLDRQEKGQHDDLTLQQVMEQGNLPMDLPKEEDEDVDAPQEEQEAPLSKEEEMAKQIMDKASYFLTSSSPQLRSQMLLLLTSGVSILASHPQELNQLVFSMWPYIINRLSDQENYVVLHAAQLIEKLSQVSTDYLSRKFEQDLWPKFKAIMKRGTTAASSKTISDYSVYSLYHRTQLCLLHTLTQIALYVPINQPTIKDILEESKFYYNNDQVHKQLSHGCQKLFKSLSTQQADTVWLYEVSLKNIEIDCPAPALLDSFVIPPWMKREN